MCCGNSILPVALPMRTAQEVPVLPVVAQVNSVLMDDNINSQRAAEMVQANFHAQNLGDNG